MKALEVLSHNRLGLLPGLYERTGPLFSLVYAKVSTIFPTWEVYFGDLSTDVVDKLKKDSSFSSIDSFTSGSFGTSGSVAMDLVALFTEGELGFSTNESDDKISLNSELVEAIILISGRAFVLTEGLKLVCSSS